MEKTCPSCYSCGMPLEKDTKYCSHCTDDKGQLKPFSQILKATAGYLSHSQGLSDDAANQLAETLLLKQPEWRKP